MTRVIGSLAILLVLAWVIAHALYLGPIEDVTETTLTWGIGLVAASGLVAALTVLGFGLVAGGPAWMRFAELARTVAAIIGAGLVVVGLLHYRDTEPQGEVRWIVFGLVVLVGAGIVHWQVVRTRRRSL